MDVAIARLFCFRTSYTILVTRAFSSWPLYGYFLVPWNRKQPFPTPQAVVQVNFLYLDCACITLHEFMPYPDTYWGHTGRVLYLSLNLLFLLASYYKVFAAWYDPFLFVDLTDWWHSLYCLFFVLVWYFTLRTEYFLSSLEALAELYEFSETLCRGMKPLGL